VLLSVCDSVAGPTQGNSCMADTHSLIAECEAVHGRTLITGILTAGMFDRIVGIFE